VHYTGGSWRLHSPVDLVEFQVSRSSKAAVAEKREDRVLRSVVLVVLSRSLFKNQTTFYT
jgi:hypothetical protein